ncbi:MAG: glycosyltransferase [Oceanospirillaceae bacterium]|nr:glycosyltransferase [Oceanospirillaceae bacterium]
MIYHITYSKIKGGAGKAASELVRLFSRDLDSDELAYYASRRGEQPAHSGLHLKVRSLIHFILRVVVYILLSCLGSRSKLSLNWFTDPILKDNLKRLTSDDILHVHWVGNETVSISYLATLPCKVIFTLHDSWLLNGICHVEVNGTARLLAVDRFIKRRKRAILNQMRGRCMFIAPSKFIVRQFKNDHFFKDFKFSVVPNLVREPFYSLNPGHRPSKHINIVCGGSNFDLDPVKGLDIFLAALSEISRYSPVAARNIVVHIFGNTNDFNVSRFPVRVQLHGILDDYQLKGLFSGCQLGVIPSYSESFGLLAAEMMLCKIPVVCFSGHAVEEIVARGERYVVSNRTPSELAQSLVRLCSNLEDLDKDGVLARENVLKICSQDRIMDLYKAIYRLEV